MTEEKKKQILKEAGVYDKTKEFEIVETKNSYKIYELSLGDTLGCILVGRDFVDINSDGLLDVTESRKTLGKLLDLSDSQVTLRVYSGEL